jgi:glycine oxidase
METSRLPLTPDSSSPYDYLIVGQGIAGTVLTHTLIKQGKKVLVIDEWDHSASSKVAAGLYNPIVFKRLTKSWMIDELLPAAENFYIELEQVLGEQFFYKKKIVKLFAEKNEKDFWLKKAKEAGLKMYLSETAEENFYPDAINSTNGAAIVKQAGNVDVKKMLILFRTHLKKQNALLEEKFSYNDIILNADGIEYKDRHAKKIIFCEGFRATENPYFNWLPFKLTKGEIITIKLPVPLDEECCINKGVFILPLGANLYKVGATYNWDELNETPTERGKNELVEKLNRVLKTPYTIIKHEAGIRPTVQDRRPLIGLHPQYHTIGIFNGLGTKGVLIAPYFATHFTKVLEGLELLMSDVDIVRFEAKSSHSSINN